MATMKAIAPSRSLTDASPGVTTAPSKAESPDVTTVAPAAVRMAFQAVAWSRWWDWNVCHSPLSPAGNGPARLPARTDPYAVTSEFSTAAARAATARSADGWAVPPTVVDVVVVATA